VAKYNIEVTKPNWDTGAPFLNMKHV